MPTNKLTLEGLVEAIRSAKSLDQLHRLIGPSKHEQEAAAGRLAYLESISGKCNFSSSCPTMEEGRYRDRWNSTMAVQTEFENRYF